MVVIDSLILELYNVNMESKVEEKIRGLSLPQLRVLRLMSQSQSSITTSKEMVNLIADSEKAIGGIIAVLRRHKINGEPLILQAGKDVETGMRWQINKNLVSKPDLVLLLDDMEVHIEIKAHK